MVVYWCEGYDVVYVVWSECEGELVFKIVIVCVFYCLFNKMLEVDIFLDIGDFCLMSCCVVDILCVMLECDCFVCGMVSWVGFK